MKRLACIAVVLSLISCGEKKSDQSSEAASAPAGVDAIKEGKDLVTQNDCTTCHHAVNKIIGPSHTDVAKKYEFTAANVKLLADRIIKGGSGVWGEVPMNPHPDLKPEDAEKMARYVLSLDGETEK